jgi:hypothetical protein
MKFSRRSSKNGQQEIAGFVIIVVLVIIALMVFVVISLRQAPKVSLSATAENALSSVLGYTTTCVVSQPYVASVRDLVRACFENRKCGNSNEMVCDYLNETLDEILPTILLNPQVSGTISAYEFRLDWDSGDEMEPVQNRIKLTRGLCNQSSSIVTAAEDMVSLGDSGTMDINLKICSEV